MPHHTPLIATVVVGFVLACALGMAAHRLRASPLVGYLLAGIVVGPFTPGLVADPSVAEGLADLGVILLMFAVGLRFSPRDLMAVRSVAAPGALAAMAAVAPLGTGLGWGLGWGVGGGFVFGLSLSVASTVVLTRALQERRLLETDLGRVAVGWLVVEDAAMVLAMVLLPAAGGALAGAAAVPAGALAAALLPALGKAAAFVAAMLLVGRRAIPRLLRHAADTGSPELFRLAVYAVALGVAYGAAALFGVSFALGAFFAGMALSESRLGERAAREAVPLRDAFAVLFFVSVGMLFDPRVLAERPWAALATVAVVVVGKPVAAALVVRGLGHPASTALAVGAGLGQVGEFSFVLAGLGVSLGLLPDEGRDLIVAGSILSILLNPLLFAAAARAGAGFGHPPVPATAAGGHGAPEVAAVGHDVLVGYGGVGALVGAGLLASGRPLVVFEEGAEAAAAARHDGAEVVLGDAADPGVLRAANLPAAQRLFVALPEGFAAGQVVGQARAANPELEIVARARPDAAAPRLTAVGDDPAVVGERGIARRMLDGA